jgi:hypothetical protein
MSSTSGSFAGGDLIVVCTDGVVGHAFTFTAEWPEVSRRNRVGLCVHRLPATDPALDRDPAKGL